MKIKIHKSPIYFIVMVSLTLEMQFAGIFRITALKKYSTMVVTVAIISMVLFVNSFFNNHIYNTLKPYRNYTNTFLLVLTVFIAIVTIYSYNRYGQTLLNYFSCFKYYLYFFMGTSLIFVFSKQKDYEDFMKILVILTVFVLILCFINSFSLKYRGVLIWKYLQYGMRNNRLRCQAPYTLVITLPYVFNKIFREKLKKDKVKWIAIFALYTAFIFYICMTRMLNLAYYGFVLFSLVLIPKNPNLRRTILIIYGLAVIVLLATGEMTSLVNYIKAQDDNFDASAQARLNSIKYFRTYFEANPLFSMGYVLPTDEYFRAIWSGKLNCYFYDDIGIINIFLHYGLVGAVPFVMCTVRIIYLTFKVYFYNKSPRRTYFLGMLVFTGISQVSLSIFDGQRLMGAVIMWSMLEYEAYSTSPKTKREKTPLISIRRNNENHTIQLRVDKPRR